MTLIETDETSSVTSIQKLVRLMQALLQESSPQSLADIAEQVDMPKPTVHRLLAQMENVGVVQRDLSGKGYAVGPAWLRLAVDALSFRAQQAPVRSILRRLVDDLGESCNLGILQDFEVLYLERVECDWPLRMLLHAGSRVPIHCTAAGKLFLSQMSSRQRRSLLSKLRLKQFTKNTLVDIDILERECKAIRANAVSINREEYHLGLIGVAVPIFARSGAMIASLAIHAPSFRMSVDEALGHVPILRAAADEMVAQLMSEECVA